MASSPSPRLGHIVVALDGDGWALTAHGVAWIVQDRELSDR
jgi:hypothetical protein